MKPKEYAAKAGEWATDADAAAEGEIGQARATLSIAYSLLAIVAVLLEDRDRLTCTGPEVTP